MNEEIIVQIGGMMFVILLLVPLAVVVAWQGFKTWQTRMSTREQIARDEAYRRLAEETVSVQQKIVENQQRMMKDLSDMKKSINAVEKMLREID